MPTTTAHALRWSGVSRWRAGRLRRLFQAVSSVRPRTTRTFLPVAMAANLAQTISVYKQQGVFVVGLDGGGDTALPALELADRPLLVVAGSEGAGLSRLVTALCDVVVSIPISAATESLNASVATSVIDFGSASGVISFLL